MNYEKVAANIRGELANYIVSNGLHSLVIGVSGGIDSAVCVALALPVCYGLGIPLIGRSIPIQTNKEDELDRARKVGEIFCTDFDEVDLGGVYRKFEERIHIAENKTNSNIAKGNIKARVRMIYLYNIAGMNNGIVLSTDNYTEMMLGFFTIHGDHNDYGMIQNLWKTEVYGLARYLADDLRNDAAKEALRACIAATPTDGLGISNSDLEQLGADTYDEVDNILQEYIKYDNLMKNRELLYDVELTRIVSNKIEKLRSHPVIIRMESSQFKRDWPFYITRESLLS